MKRFLLLFIIGISVAAFFLFSVSHDPGYVRISIGNWLVESNLWVMAGANLFLIIFIVFTLNITGKLLNTGKFFTQWFGRSNSHRANSNTQKGLISLLEGNWVQANKLLSKSATKSSTPLINYLAAAHAANELGQVKEAESLLRKAYDSTPNSEFAVGVAQAQIQLQQNKYEPCLATLLRLRKQQTNHPFILKLLKTVYLKLEDWSHLLELLPILKKAPNANNKKLDQLERLSWNQLFIQKTDELINLAKQADGESTLATLWKKVPDKLRYDAELIKIYAEQLIRLNQQSACETLLRKILNKHWHNDLVSIYGIVAGKNVSEQLVSAENWLKERPNNAVLLLALGRLSLRNELWGKALEYFEASKRLHATQESHAELCRLSIRLKPNTDEHLAQVNALIQLLGLPDLPLPKAKPSISEN